MGDELSGMPNLRLILCMLFPQAHDGPVALRCNIYFRQTVDMGPCCRAQKLGSVSAECCLKARCTTLVIKVSMLLMHALVLQCQTTAQRYLPIIINPIQYIS